MNEEISIKLVNGVLSNIESIRNTYRNTTWNKISEIVERRIDDEGEQGGEGQSVEVYQNTAHPNIYVKLEIRTDSYGENERITSIQFVQPVRKEVTDFESIK